jgi:hypothetical protein
MVLYVLCYTSIKDEINLKGRLGSSTVLQWGLKELKEMQDRGSNSIERENTNVLKRGGK